MLLDTTHEFLLSGRAEKVTAHRYVRYNLYVRV
jgi:hypothetical protein